jgi:hypothetical protein
MPCVKEDFPLSYRLTVGAVLRYSRNLPLFSDRGYTNVRTQTMGAGNGKVYLCFVNLPDKSPTARLRREQ